MVAEDVHHCFGIDLAGEVRKDGAGAGTSGCAAAFCTRSVGIGVGEV